MVEVYQPEEDSYLLSRVLKKEKVDLNTKILDMGAGTGIQAQTLIDRGVLLENVTLVDINTEAIKLLKKKFKKSKVIKSNLFKKVKGKFDLIIFNPPYLPEDPREPADSRIATTGGKTGSEIINKFLKEAKKHLTKEGKIFLLTSSLTKGINWKGYKKKILSRKKVFYETLKVFSLLALND
jgi:release factor glutamine methyltransferase